MKILRFAAYFMAILFPVLAYASPIVPTPAVVANNPGLFQWLLGLMILYNLVLQASKMKADRKNNEAQWEAIHHNHDSLEAIGKDVIKLTTEHEIYHKGGRDE